jgi:hypothetical protein
MFNRHRRMGKTKVRSSFCPADIPPSGNTRSRSGERFGLGKFLKRKDFQCDESCIGGRRRGRDRANLERTPRQELYEPRYFSRCWRGPRKTACAHQDQDAAL